MYLDEYAVRENLPTFVLHRIPDIIKHINPVVVKEQRNGKVHEINLLGGDNKPSGSIVWDIDEEECVIYTYYPTIHTKREVQKVEEYASMIPHVSGILWIVGDEQRIASISGLTKKGEPIYMVIYKDVDGKFVNYRAVMHNLEA